MKIKCTRNLILNQRDELLPEVQQRIENIKKATGTQIRIIGFYHDSEHPHAPPGLSSNGKNQTHLEIEIQGTWDSLEKAKLRILLMLDQLVCTNIHDSSYSFLQIL